MKNHFFLMLVPFSLFSLGYRVFYGAFLSLSISSFACLSQATISTFPLPTRTKIWSNLIVGPRNSCCVSHSLQLISFVLSEPNREAHANNKAEYGDFKFCHTSLNCSSVSQARQIDAPLSVAKLPMTCRAYDAPAACE